MQVPASSWLLESKQETLNITQGLEPTCSVLSTMPGLSTWKRQGSIPLITDLFLELGTQEISEVMFLADLICDGFPRSFISPSTLTFASFSIMREILSPTLDLLKQLDFFSVCLGVQRWNNLSDWLKSVELRLWPREGWLGLEKLGIHDDVLLFCECYTEWTVLLFVF